MTAPDAPGATNDAGLASQHRATPQERSEPRFCPECGQPRSDLRAVLTDPNHPTILSALTTRCPICQQPPQTLCTNPCGGGPLPGRLIHHARIQTA